MRIPIAIGCLLLTLSQSWSGSFAEDTSSSLKRKDASSPAPVIIRYSRTPEANDSDDSSDASNAGDIDPNRLGQTDRSGRSRDKRMYEEEPLMIFDDAEDTVATPEIYDEIDEGSHGFLDPDFPLTEMTRRRRTIDPDQLDQTDRSSHSRDKRMYEEDPLMIYDDVEDILEAPEMYDEIDGGYHDFLDSGFPLADMMIERRRRNVEEPIVEEVVEGPLQAGPNTDEEFVELIADGIEIPETSDILDFSDEVVLDDAHVIPESSESAEETYAFKREVSKDETNLESPPSIAPKAFDLDGVGEAENDKSRISRDPAKDPEGEPLEGFEVPQTKRDLVPVAENKLEEVTKDGKQPLELTVVLENPLKQAILPTESGPLLEENHPHSSTMERPTKNPEASGEPSEGPSPSAVSQIEDIIILRSDQTESTTSESSTTLAPHRATSPTNDEDPETRAARGGALIRLVTSPLTQINETSIEALARHCDCEKLSAVAIKMLLAPLVNHLYPQFPVIGPIALGMATKALTHLAGTVIIPVARLVMTKVWSVLQALLREVSHGKIIIGFITELGKFLGFAWSALAWLRTGPSGAFLGNSDVSPLNIGKSTNFEVPRKMDIDSVERNPLILTLASPGTMNLENAVWSWLEQRCLEPLKRFRVVNDESFAKVKAMLSKGTREIVRGLTENLVSSMLKTYEAFEKLITGVHGDSHMAVLYEGLVKAVKELPAEATIVELRKIVRDFLARNAIEIAKHSPLSRLLESAVELLKSLPSRWKIIDVYSLGRSILRAFNVNAKFVAQRARQLMPTRLLKLLISSVSEKFRAGWEPVLNGAIKRTFSSNAEDDGAIEVKKSCWVKLLIDLKADGLAMMLEGVIRIVRFVVSTIVREVSALTRGIFELFNLGRLVKFLHNAYDLCARPMRKILVFPLKVALEITLAVTELDKVPYIGQSLTAKLLNAVSRVIEGLFLPLQNVTLMNNFTLKEVAAIVLKSLDVAQQHLARVLSPSNLLRNQLLRVQRILAGLPSLVALKERLSPYSILKLWNSVLHVISKFIQGWLTYVEKITANVHLYKDKAIALVLKSLRQKIEPSLARMLELKKDLNSFLLVSTKKLSNAKQYVEPTDEMTDEEEEPPMNNYHQDFPEDIARPTCDVSKARSRWFANLFDYVGSSGKKTSPDTTVVNVVPDVSSPSRTVDAPSPVSTLISRFVSRFRNNDESVVPDSADEYGPVDVQYPQRPNLRNRVSSFLASPTGRSRMRLDNPSPLFGTSNNINYPAISSQETTSDATLENTSPSKGLRVIEAIDLLRGTEGKIDNPEAYFKSLESAEPSTCPLEIPVYRQSPNERTIGCMDGHQGIPERELMRKALAQEHASHTEIKVSPQTPLSKLKSSHLSYRKKSNERKEGSVGYLLPLKDLETTEAHCNM